MHCLKQSRLFNLCVHHKICLLFYLSSCIQVAELQDDCVLLFVQQVSSLTCNIQYGHQMPLSRIKNCAVKMISSMSDIEKWHDFVTEHNKLDNLMCPVHDDNISQNLDLSVLKDGCSFISWCTSSASSDHECSVQLEVFKVYTLYFP